jgi:hypothetical protein
MAFLRLVLLFVWGRGFLRISCSDYRGASARIS